MQTQYFLEQAKEHNMTEYNHQPGNVAIHSDLYLALVDEGEDLTTIKMRLEGSVANMPKA